MRPLWKIVRSIWAREWWSLTRGTLLAVAVLLAGVGLLALSGWFITAAGIAGLAGLGIAFDVFRPSAGVRFLALGRTVARYGERMLTHDATLRSLAALRVELLKGMLRLPHEKTAAFRASVQLNRLTSDVDALDGVALRLVIPLLAAGITLTVTLVTIRYLVHGWMSLAVLAGLVPLTLAALLLLLLRSRKPARRAHTAQNAFRMRVIDLLRGRTELAIAGRLQAQCEHVLDADRRSRIALAEADRLERNSGLLISLAETVTGGAVLALGIFLAQSGMTGAAFAALAFFAVLALGETVMPLRRGFTEFGKMVDSARRVAPMLQEVPEGVRPAETPVAAATVDSGGAVLSFRDVGFTHRGAGRPVVEHFSLDVKAGETVALTGPSGCGKSTLLALAAGIMQPSHGGVRVGGEALTGMPEARLRQKLGLLPQRSALLSGSVLDALRLGAPQASEEEAWDVLAVVRLDEAIRARGGLSSLLGESGSGLSGGESRRLALARLLLRHPQILLLDEPTEGLDGATAQAVLVGIRHYLPQAAILIASHRKAEQDVAGRIIRISPKTSRSGT